MLNILLLGIRPLSIFLPKLSAYRRDFDKTKIISFLMKDEKCYKNIMKFDSNIINKEFDSKPLHNGKYLKLK